MPIATSQHGFAECGEKFYAVAGQSTAGAHLASTQEYDPASDTWAAKADLPYAYQSGVLRTVNGKLYSIGGYSSDADAWYDDVYEYDPALNTWTAKTDMPTPREDMGSAVIDGKIYVFGGLTTGATPTKVLEIYDPATDTWDSTKADMPDFKQLGDFGAAYDGKVYAIGATNTMAGYPNLTPTTTVYQYNPATDAWSTVAPIPAAVCYTEIIEHGSYLYVITGATTSTTDYSDAIYRYNPASDTWTYIGKWRYSMARTAGLSYGGKIYLSGGFDGAYRNYLVRWDDPA